MLCEGKRTKVVKQLRSSEPSFPLTVPNVHQLSLTAATRARKRHTKMWWRRPKVQMGDGTQLGFTANLENNFSSQNDENFDANNLSNGDFDSCDLSNQNFDGCYQSDDNIGDFNQGNENSVVRNRSFRRSLLKQKDNDEEKKISLNSCPFGYKGYYSATRTRLDKDINSEVPLDDNLPVHYWFYVFVHSSDVDRLLKPLLVPQNRSSIDKRLLGLMRRNQVRIVLKHIELYKSLPRRVVVVKALNWERILSALAELETVLPGIMKFASYPMLMDTKSYRYACTSNISHIFTKQKLNML